MTATEGRDVLVVGGGFAGTTAARDLSQRGHDVLLLEARDRLGGRTWTTEREGWTVELGGTWVHWSQPFVWAEIQRYGLELEETVGVTAERVVLVVAGKPIELDGAQQKELVAGFGRFFAEARYVWTRPWDSHFRRQELERRDEVSVAERLEALRLPPLQETAVATFLEALAHGPLEQASYVEMMRVYALAGATYPLLADSVARYKIARGTGALIEAMARDGGFDSRLETAVAAIRHDGDGVAATTADGTTFAARAAVVTLPMNVLGQVDFEPPLSATKLQASRERHAGVGFKLFLEVDGDPAPFMVLARSCDNPLGTCFTFRQRDGRSLLVAFGVDGELVERMSLADWQRALDAVVPGLRLTKTFHHAWTHDPLANGTWCSYKPGQFSRFADELARTEGHLFFAGADHGEGWRGFIDGAIASGTRAAAAVARRLG